MNYTVGQVTCVTEQSVACDGHVLAFDIASRPARMCQYSVLGATHNEIIVAASDPRQNNAFGCCHVLLGLREGRSPIKRSFVLGKQNSLFLHKRIHADIGGWYCGLNEDWLEAVLRGMLFMNKRQNSVIYLFIFVLKIHST